MPAVETDHIVKSYADKVAVDHLIFLHWAHSSISDVGTLDWIPPYRDATFQPDGTISKADVVKGLIRATTINLTPTGRDLTDVHPEQSSYPYVETAVQRGWIDLEQTNLVRTEGLPLYFDPAMVYSRAQAAELLYRASVLP